MALPGSGALSLSDIQTEFGGSNPISLSEYYGVDTGVPASGTISIDDFYGTSSGPTVTVPASFEDVRAYSSLATGSVTLDLSGMTMKSGDIIYAYICGQDATAVATPSGWTALQAWQTSSGTYPGQGLWGIAATGTSQSDPTFTVTGTGNAMCALVFIIDGTYDSVYGVSNGSGVPNPTGILNDQTTSIFVHLVGMGRNDGNNAWTADALMDGMLTDFGRTEGGKDVHLIAGYKRRPGFGGTYNPGTFDSGSGGTHRILNLFHYNAP